jgi:hypothetical protein
MGQKNPKIRWGMPPRFSHWFMTGEGSPTIAAISVGPQSTLLQILLTRRYRRRDGLYPYFWIQEGVNHVP